MLDQNQKTFEGIFQRNVEKYMLDQNQKTFVGIFQKHVVGTLQNVGSESENICWNI